MIAHIIAPVRPVRKVLSERIWTASRAHGSYQWFRAKVRGDHATGSEGTKRGRNRGLLISWSCSVAVLIGSGTLHGVSSRVSESLTGPSVARQAHPATPYKACHLLLFWNLSTFLLWWKIGTHATGAHSRLSFFLWPSRHSRDHLWGDAHLHKDFELVTVVGTI